MQPEFGLPVFPRYERPVIERPPPHEIFSVVILVENAILDALYQGRNAILSWTSSNGRLNEFRLVDILSDPDYSAALKSALSSSVPNIDSLIAIFWVKFSSNLP